MFAMRRAVVGVARRSPTAARMFSAAGPSKANPEIVGRLADDTEQATGLRADELEEAQTQAAFCGIASGGSRASH